MQVGTDLYLIIVDFQSSGVFDIPICHVISVFSEIIRVFDVQQEIVDASDIADTVCNGCNPEIR